MTEQMKIYTYPDPVLRSVCKPVENIDENIQKLIDSMAETMYAAPGIGLAATQVGVPIRLLVYDIHEEGDKRNLSVVINPEIVLAEDSIVFSEACLSVPDFSADVVRKARVKVKGVDREGNPLDIEAEDLEAVCLQHEIDHLNGVLYIDHISSLKRSLYKKKLKKMAK
ncbi:MAG: peptide deformylase [Deltaproteobacteria bacterium]|nr:peptide deformylase [Deltaproteobacteria bacterium]